MNPEAEDPRPDLTPHPLAPDPEDDDGLADPAVTVVVGYLGRARDDAHVRIYADLSFSGYYELLAADVTSTSSVDPTDEASPTAVYLRASAEVSFVRVTRLSGSASFVSGAIRSRYGQGRQPRGRFVPAEQDPHSLFGYCPPPAPTDPSQCAYCPTDVFCESVDYCSIDFDCESVALIVCRPG
jgi:hypothetical protein